MVVLLTSSTSSSRLVAVEAHPWLAAVAKARKALGCKGFIAIKKGSALYNKAKSFYGPSKASPKK